LKTYIR